MSIQGASATVSGLAVTLAVAGAFPAAYQVAISTSWVTTIDVVSKTAAGFTVNFGTPAPGGGGTLDWIVSDSTTSTSQAITSATETATAAAVSSAVVVTASLPASYQVSIAPAWVTAYDIVSKTSAGFTVNWATPVPVGGSTFDYIIYGPAAGTVSLADYLDELRDLLHDPNDRFTSALQKANYINRARRRRDVDTAINRSTITFALTAGTDTYTFAQVGNGQIIDVFSIVLIFGQWRTLLDAVSLSELNMAYRPSTNFTGWTKGWARQGETTVILGPSPSQAFTTEWDAVVYLPPLVALTDTDALSYPYTQPVPYYAASLAKTNERMGGSEGDWFLEKYHELVGMSVNQRAPRVPNNYAGIGSAARWRG